MALRFFGTSPFVLAALRRALQLFSGPLPRHLKGSLSSHALYMLPKLEPQALHHSQDFSLFVQILP